MSEDQPSVPVPTKTPVDPNDPMSVPRLVWENISENVGGYVLSALGTGIAVFTVVFGSFIVMGLGFLPGLAADDEEMMTWGLLASFSLAFLFLMAWSILVAPLMSATLMRAMDAARQGDAEALTLASPFRGLADNAGSILMLHVVGMFMVLIGSMFCVIPGLIAGIVVGFATPMVALDRVPPMEALGHSWRHFTSHLSWHLLVWVIHVAIAMVVGMVGVGAFLAIPLAAAFQMAAYRVAYGDGGVPRTAF